MTMRAQSQVARMLELVPYLQARGGVPVADVARDFGVKPAQIVKDLNVLWFCGLPNSVSGDMIDVDMEALEDDGIVRISNAEFLTRPLRLTPAEALALIVALRALAESAGPRQREPVDRALAKIEAAAGERSAQAAAVDVQLDMGDPEIRGQAFAGRHHLAHDLPGAQVALEPHRAGVAEGAGEAAADLSGHAEREPIRVRHQHRLDARAVAVTEHELLAAVL